MLQLISKDGCALRWVDVGTGTCNAGGLLPLVLVQGVRLLSRGLLAAGAISTSLQAVAFKGTYSMGCQGRGRGHLLAFMAWRCLLVAQGAHRSGSAGLQSICTCDDRARVRKED